MLRVTHIIKATRIAGAETHLLTLLKGLRAHQIDAQVILLVEPGKPMVDYITLLEQHAIPVHALLIYANVDPTLMVRLFHLLQLMRPQIVHTHLLHADLHGGLAARWAGVPVLITSRHNDNAFRRREPYRSLQKQLWQMTTAGIVISESIAQFVIEVEGAPPPKVQVIRYGLDYQPLTPAERQTIRRSVREQLDLGPDTPVVGIICRLVEQKGVTYGLQAFAQVAKQLPDACFLIAGEGPLRSSLEEEAAQLGVNVRFLGWYDDVPRLLCALDVLLVPSIWEGFGLVILEAMSRQIPVVASSVSAIPEIVMHGETGLLVQPRDVEEISAALWTLLNDIPLRRHMGLLAEDRLAMHFTAQRMVNETVNLYRQLV